MASRKGDKWRGRVYLAGGGERTKLFKTRREAQRREQAQRDRYRGRDLVLRPAHPR